MPSDLWCSPKCTRRPHQVSLHGLSRPQPILGSLSQQFPVLQRKGENPSRPFPPSPVTLQTCLPLHPSSSRATSEGSAQLQSTLLYQQQHLQLLPAGPASLAPSLRRYGPQDPPLVILLQENLRVHFLGNLT